MATGDGGQTVEYFYYEACGSCEQERISEISAAFRSACDEFAPDWDYKLNLMNSFKPALHASLNSRYDELGVDKSIRDNTAVFYDGSYLIGEKSIDDNLGAFIKNAGTPHHLANSPVPAQTIVYFYITACEECQAVQAELNSLPVNVNIESINIGIDDSLPLLYSYYESYSVPEDSQILPIVFAGEKFYGYAGVIAGNLAEDIINSRALGTLLPGDAQNAVTYDAGTVGRIEIPGVLLAGLINGVNPCGLSMFLFFITLFAAKGNNILLFGISYVIGKFATYLFIGIAGYNLIVREGDILSAGLGAVVKTVLAAASLVIAALSFHDFFASRAERYDRIKLQLPPGLRRLNHHIIKTAGSVSKNKNNLIKHIIICGCFLLGAIISLTEFLCTGQTYVATIAYAISRGGGYRAEILFLIYSFAAIIPAVLILTILWRGKSAFEISETIRVKMPLIKLANAIFFAVFTVIVLII